MVISSDDDNELLKFGTSFVNLRVRDFEELTGRSKRALQARLRKLTIQWRTTKGERKGDEHSGLGYFYTLPSPLNRFENVYFPTQKGWDKALQLGLVSHEVNANREKQDGQLEHDLVLTDFHKALHFAFGEKLRWSQLYKARYHRWGKKPEQYINADAFFYVEIPDGYASFFVEVENQKGTQEPARKMRAYSAFAEGHYQDIFKSPDFRVILLKPSREMVLNLVHAIKGEKDIATRRFWINDYAAALKPGESNYLTPRDFAERPWGFPDLTGSL